MVDKTRYSEIRQVSAENCYKYDEEAKDTLRCSIEWDCCTLRRRARLIFPQNSFIWYSVPRGTVGYYEFVKFIEMVQGTSIIKNLKRKDRTIRVMAMELNRQVDIIDLRGIENP